MPWFNSKHSMRLAPLAGGLALWAVAAAAMAQDAYVERHTGPFPTPGPTPPPVTYTVPDWTGVWMQYGSRNFDPTTKSGEIQPNAPLTPEARKAYEAVLAARKAGKPEGDIGCLPAGMPRMMRSPYPMEVVITPKETWIMQEAKGEIRRIYTDGRKAPTGEALDPTFEGYSTGHWEGDTLVIDTVGIKPGGIDSGGLVHTPQLSIHERMRRLNSDILQDQITLTDPGVFTKPWTVTRIYHREPKYQIKEYVCENERNPISANGTTGVTLQH